MLFWSYISSECELRDEFIVKIEPVKSLQTFGKDIKITVVCTNPQTVIQHRLSGENLFHWAEEKPFQSLRSRGNDQQITAAVKDFYVVFFFKLIITCFVITIVWGNFKNVLVWKGYLLYCDIVKMVVEEAK